MSDKKEVAELSIKVSVDTTELDKLEAQLKRIAGLLIDADLKNKVEFKIDIASGNAEFTGITTAITQAKAFVNDVFIDKAVVQDAVCKATNHTPSKIMCRVGDMTYMRDGSVLLGSEGYIGKADSDAAKAFNAESLNQAAMVNVIETHKIQEAVNLAVGIIKDQDKAFADAVRQVMQKATIDVLRNNAKGA
ncbi:hypothetical protein GKR59_04550 [Providencia alcalifaciens]|uniref:hypothetical protein n=1 Tax=Providencia TaxID=586 RepID=UPI0012B56C43|nr:MULTISPECIES: hypothetical protein [Providencia]MTC48918.1 hypothetical protein [Providencia alcalifaciens]